MSCTSSMGRGEEVVGPGAEGEAAAASDPEDCEETKYGWLPEQMQSLLGNCFEASWKSQGTKRQRKAQIMSDLQESPSPWAGSSNRALPVLPGSTLPSCSVISPLMRSSVDTEARASGRLQSRTMKHYKNEWGNKKKKKKQSLKIFKISVLKQSNFVNLHMWSSFWGWNEDPQRHLCG